MRYYVVLPTGQKFGPADATLLNQWILEGRVASTSILEEEGTGRQVSASTVPGLMFGGFSGQPPTTYAPYQGSTMANPAGYSTNPYPRGHSDTGQSDMTVSWVLSAIGIVGILPFIGPIIGLVYAKKAQAKGNSSAGGGILFAYIVLSLNVLGCCCYMAMFAGGIGGFFGS
jgi:hypothetical protein